MPRRRPSPSRHAARKPQKKTIEVVDNFYSPRKLTVNLKSRINWVWTDESADVHDVKLISAPKGFKKFQTEPGSAGSPIPRR